MRKNNIRWLTGLLVIIGFLLTLSYKTAADQVPQEKEPNYFEEDQLRNTVLEEQEKNYELEEEWRSLQTQVREMEETLAQNEESSFNLVEDLEKLRMLTGEVGVAGPGIEVTLNDHTFVPEEGNPNDYIVHERHIQQVIDELLLAGAEAISVNGYRISKDTFIQCMGPVIKIDNNTSTAPFVVKAIGDSEQLETSLKLNGGVQDSLVNENIEVRIQTETQVTMQALGGESD
ncbi:uncharacterized protein YlxW (UPF0749 family) [Salibacterium salarium]|uniref:DUF881 domain-containing protein n=1 Tax=Salibacterium salarium TaxID=284579 RepID=UPI00277DB891|nr:DUF881 domain-containing protein [Salibacterium salarium]MDQ0299045.1 uncharacterized protein YlxW (UPF0749 family) [Salibacterium salarium]